ncbi:MAG: hypothetical protein COV71_05145 [Candidatus Omnitrophica bacterium CG11_big_fil_rev_8_21_14_0_20_41_12]|nr:MAG: hypothetical protein COV71_05145 [Candidatus Omnitrophica bacterium CG11_big_fil_rev_8_21_14_0_20_41_12]
MNISQECKKKIEKIMAEFKCPKDFKCYKAGLENICKAKDRGLIKYIDCLEADPMDCIFAVAFGTGYFCRCPLRVYIVKELKK